MSSWSRAVRRGGLRCAWRRARRHDAAGKPPKKQTLPRWARLLRSGAREPATRQQRRRRRRLLRPSLRRVRAGPEVNEEEAEEEAAEEVAAEPIAVDAPSAKPASAPSPAAAGSKASVQFMITGEMKEKLRALGYSEDDIAQLQPERARVIVTRGLKRTSKLPASWTRSAQRDGPIVAAWRRIKQHTTTPAGMAGLAAGGLATVLMASR